jgi:hypothetical protein
VARSRSPSPSRSANATAVGSSPADNVASQVNAAGVVARDVDAVAVRHGQVRIAVAVEVAERDVAHVRPAEYE